MPCLHRSQTGPHGDPACMIHLVPPAVGVRQTGQGARAVGVGLAAVEETGSNSQTELPLWGLLGSKSGCHSGPDPPQVHGVAKLAMHATAWAAARTWVGQGQGTQRLRAGQNPWAGHFRLMGHTLPTPVLEGRKFLSLSSPQYHCMHLLFPIPLMHKHYYMSTTALAYFLSFMNK